MPNIILIYIKSGVCNPMAREPHVALQTVFLWPSSTLGRCMLFVLIFAISFLANTISVEIFQALEFTTSVHYVFFWHIEYDSI